MNVTFRQVIIDYADLRRKETGALIRLHCSADVTKPVQEAMEWEEVPTSVSSAKLEGSLSAEKIVFTPTDKKLRDFETEMQCSRVEDFTLSRKTEGEKVVTRLRFICLVDTADAITYVAEWMKKVGDAPAALKVQYIEQSELDLQGSDKGAKATDEQRKAAMDIPVN